MRIFYILVIVVAIHLSFTFYKHYKKEDKKTSYYEGYNDDYKKWKEETQHKYVNASNQNIISVKENNYNRFQEVQNKNGKFFSPEEILSYLPEELLPYKENISKIIRPYVKITLNEIDLKEEKKDMSKVGGLPFMGKGYIYPKDKKGNPMLFLAQINFSELSENKDFPSGGLLQFYIANDSVWGLSFEDLQKGDIKIIYVDEKHLDYEYENSDIDIEKIYSEIKNIKYLPFSKFPVVFKIEYENSFMLPLTDNLEMDGLKIEDEDVLELYFEFANYVYGSVPFHQIGGSPFFTQNEVRKSENQKLLLQIDSQYEKGNTEIMRGDSGVMNFFIDEKDLKDKKFDKIYYNWDCY